MTVVDAIGCTKQPFLDCQRLLLVLLLTSLTMTRASAAEGAKKDGGLVVGDESGGVGIRVDTRPVMPSADPAGVACPVDAKLLDDERGGETGCVVALGILLEAVEVV